MGVAKSTVLKIGSAGTPSTLVDISTKTSGVKFPREADAVESTAFQAAGNAKTFLVGLINGQLSFEVNYDATIDAQLAGLLGVDAVSFEYGPEGSTTGYTKYTGTFVLTKYEPPATVGQLIKGSVELQLTGQVTRTTYP